MREAISANLKILLTEDDKGHAALLTKNLWRTCVDAHIIHFSDGEKLLAYLSGESNLPEKFEPGKYILLLDIKMPKIDGIEVLRAIKKDPQMSKTPVIMLTTTNNPSEVELCYEMGCSFYVVKPADYIKFMETIEYLGAFLSISSLIIPVIESPSLVID